MFLKLFLPIIALVITTLFGGSYAQEGATPSAAPVSQLQGNVQLTPEMIKQFEQMYGVLLNENVERDRHAANLPDIYTQPLTQALEVFKDLAKKMSVDAVIAARSKAILAATEKLEAGEYKDSLLTILDKLIEYSTQHAFVTLFNPYAFDAALTDLEQVRNLISRSMNGELGNRYKEISTFIADAHEKIKQLPPILRDSNADVQGLLAIISGLKDRDTQVLSQEIIKFSTPHLTTALTCLKTAHQLLKDASHDMSLASEQRAAAGYFARELGVHCKTLTSFRAIAWVSKFDLNILLGSVQLISDMLEPYIYCYKFQTDQALLSSKALYIDALLRGTIISLVFGQGILSDLRSSVQKVTIDGEDLEAFANPLQDSIFGVSRLVSHGQLMFTQNFIHNAGATGRSEGVLNKIYFGYLAPYRRQLIQLVTAITWHNISKTEGQSRWPAENPYFAMVVGTVISRINTTASNYLAGKAYTMLGDKVTYNMERYTLGIAKIDLIAEVLDISVISLLMQKNPMVEAIASISPEVILSGHYTYRHGMLNLFKKLQSGSDISKKADREAYNEFLRKNWDVFVEYRLLDYAASNIGEQFGRLIAEPLWNLAGKISSKIYNMFISDSEKDAMCAEIQSDYDSIAGLLIDELELVLAPSKKRVALAAAEGQLPLQPNTSQVVEAPDHASADAQSLGMLLGADSGIRPMLINMMRNAHMLDGIDAEKNEIRREQKINYTIVKTALQLALKYGVIRYPDAIDLWDIYMKNELTPRHFVVEFKARVLSNIKKAVTGKSFSWLSSFCFSKYYFSQGPIFRTLKSA